jgi:hypothetical protein
MDQIFINSKWDQSWKSQYIQLMWKKKLEREKIFTHFNEMVVKRDKIKCLVAKSCVEVILKDCQMPLPTKF